MILLDAHPLIAYLGDELPVSELVEPLLANSAVTTLNAAEVIDHFVRLRNVAPDVALTDMRQLGLIPIVVRARLAEEAALLRARHYHRHRCAVSMADCIAGAAALHVPSIEALATSDPALLGLVHAEGGEVLVLPDSQGRVWSPSAEDWRG